MSLLTPSARGLIFEERVRCFLSRTLNLSFSKAEIIIGPADNPIRCIFDVVSRDHIIIGEVKDYKWRQKRKFPNGKFEALKQDLQKLQLARAQRKLLILSDDISSGGKSLIGAFMNRLAKGQLLNCIEIWRYDQGTKSEKDSATQLRGPNIGITFVLADGT